MSDHEDESMASHVSFGFYSNQKLKEINPSSAKPFRIPSAVRKGASARVFGTTCFRRTLPQGVFATLHYLSFRGSCCSLCETRFRKPERVG